MYELEWRKFFYIYSFVFVVFVYRDGPKEKGCKTVQYWA